MDGGLSRRWLGPVAALAVIALDRVTKRWIESSLDLWSAQTVIPGFFDLVHSQNRGMAFGLLNDGASEATRYLLIAVSIAVLGFLVHLTVRAWGEAKESVPMPLFLVLGGAIGNLWDRVQRGYVTDFLDFHVSGWTWPAFNVADSAITVGALWLLWEMLRTAKAPEGKQA
jgi:signal peptidase II